MTRPDKQWNGVVELSMTHAGSEAWRGQHELGLREAVVSDEGCVAGFGYTGNGFASYPPATIPPDWPLGSVLHVFAFAPDGTRLLDEIHERTGPLGPDGSPNPKVAGLFQHPELGRFVVRVYDADVNRGAEEWWGYELATGKLLFRERPKQKLALEERCRLVTARPLPCTPLVLLHWQSWRWEPRQEDGAVFQLVDAEWNAVWTLALPHDYEKLSARERHKLLESGSVVVVGPGRFELHLVADRKRVTFAVELTRQVPPSETGPVTPGPEGTEGWSVTEVERKDASGKKTVPKK